MSKLIPKNWDKFQHYKDRSPPWIKLHRDLLDNRNYWKLSPVAAKYLPLIWLISSEKDGFIPEVGDLAFRLRINESETSDIIDELTKSEFLVSVDDEQVEKITTNAKFVAAQNGFGSRHISDKTKRFVWTRDEGKCQYCNATKDIEYDHIVPVSRGGNSDIDNIQLLCRPCNRKKRSKTAEQVDTDSLSSRILETETETETEKKIDSFDIFWTAYPRKTAKGNAENSWKKIKPDEKLVSDIIAAIAKQKPNWTDPKFIPHPATWLNGKRWLDGVEVTTGKQLKYWEKGYSA